MAEVTPKEQAFQKIKELIERFREHVEEYKRNNYNEHQTRVDFINPFFKALGWDMDNEQGFAEAYREVIHEDKVKVGGSTKAPDYGFTLFGQRKFFVDAKKPSINIKDDISPAYQVRRYGWSAKVPISIVTDFEEFSVYDCTKKPSPTDKASVSRIKYITYDQYLDDFDFLWDVFAKENLPKGRFDKYVQSDTRKKGTTTVDDEFLKSIEQWRIYLATNIALRNISLNEDEINFAVQKIIDRIIFLRMCEDRGVEQYGVLKKATEKSDIYQNLFVIYRMADAKYNSGLFDFKEDKITPGLKIDDKVLKTIIKDLYYPNCEYEFSVMPADILGSVYERFLGKTIRLTKAHHAKIEEKPEVRKAGGVYYTPKYVVDYIVENTVGKLIEGKTPNQIEMIKICDPACGSGSFLIGAYQYLLYWHLKYYFDNPQKQDGPLTPDGNLTTAEKKRILLNNIFGVDIDAQAVEVTKLNLLLKALEGETQASINHQLSLFNERVLPNLDKNIKCGNSLIGPNFYDDKLDLFPEQIKKINAFDWEQGFPEIFKKGGFDAVIGNPPYVDVKILEKEIKEELSRTYRTASNRFDLYVPFVEKGIKLIKPNGLLSYILPSMFARRDYGLELRKEILRSAAIVDIVDFGTNQVFTPATNYVSIYTIKRDGKQYDVPVIRFDRFGLKSEEIEHEFKYRESNAIKEIVVSKTAFNESQKWYLFSDAERVLFEKLSKGFEPLGKYLEHASEGIHSGKDSVFFIPNDTASRLKLESPPVYMLAKGKDIHRYDSTDSNKFRHSVIYPYDLETGEVLSESWLKKNSPNTYKHLSFCKKDLGGRGYFEKSNKEWYELWCQRTPSLYTNKKIVGPEIANKGEFTLSLKTLFINNKLKSIVPKDGIDIKIEYLLGLLNSQLVVYFHRLIAPPKDGGYFEVKTGFLNELPIKPVDFSNSYEKQAHDRIVKLVDNLLNLNKQMQTTKLEFQRQQIQSTIDHSEKKIDELVYELYGLSEEEIEIIEKKYSKAQ